MEKPIRNMYELEYQPRPFPVSKELEATYSGAKMNLVSRELGAEKLGYNVTLLDPGMRAYPFHVHHQQEEMFMIVEGEGTLRYGDQEYPIKAGDIIACLPGDASRAHQIINTSEAPLRYLSVSSFAPLEVAQYPDSGKFGVLGKDVRYIGKLDESQDYWEGNT